MGIFRYPSPPAETPLPAATETGSAAAEEDDQGAPRPRFDFYTLLKETEVMVPEQDGAAPPQAVEITSADEPRPPEQEADTAEPKLESGDAAPTPQATAPAPAEQTVYVLQAGSFKQAADADSVRARLLLLNLQASIEKVTTNNNETWHRVLIGPFKTQAESSEVRQVLTSNGIDSIQLKRRL